MTSTYDLIIIGTGPGGYVCAIRAAQLGMKVAVVEKRATHGGTCLNIGCIPSKALLHASEMFDVAVNDFEQLGIEIGKPKINLKAMMKHRSDVVEAGVKGVNLLLRKNKIEQFQGTGKVLKNGKIEVVAENGDSTTLNAKRIVIATGSVSANLKNIKIDETRIVTSTGALVLNKVPNKLLVIGAGVIGLEIGSIWRRIGAQVTVVETMDHILPGMDRETSRKLQNILKQQGMGFKLSSKVTSIDSEKNIHNVNVLPDSGGDMEKLEADVILMAIGRKPYTEGLGLQKAGIDLDEQGRIKIDQKFKTSLDGVYAIGDVIAGPMLAHKASEEGVAVAEIIAGQDGHVNYNTIPNVIYTMPEVASIGKTEEELKKEGKNYTSSKFPMNANGRARAMCKTSGYIKMLADTKTDQILGAHMIGANVGDIIHEIAVLMEFGGSAEDLARTCHAHPTLSEAVKEAALGIDKRAIHI